MSIVELKANADEIVSAVHAGEDVEIMREGRSVARLVGADGPELVDARTPEQKRQQYDAVTALMELGREIRARNGPTTAAEIKEWINESRP